MLRSVKEIITYKLDASDGEIGHCKDFLFDDEFWTIRYMIADTRQWLPGRKVLISPISLGRPSWKKGILSVRLTKDQIKNSPVIEEAQPVSVQKEMEFLRYLELPYYWLGSQLRGIESNPAPLYNKTILLGNMSNKKPRENRLRSTNELIGYNIQAIDQKVGPVNDFIVDDKTWTIRYLIVDTRSWLPGKKVLMAPDWIGLIKWSESKLFTELTKDQVKNCPEFDPSKPINRDYEVKLYDFYGRPKYWD
jgi:hypothetical protein